MHSTFFPFKTWHRLAVVTLASIPLLCSTQQPLVDYSNQFDKTDVIVNTEKLEKFNRAVLDFLGHLPK